MRIRVLTPALAAGLAASLLALGASAAQPAPVPGGTTPTPSISVVGEGIVLAPPDAARITVGVEVVDPSLATAQAEAARRADAVIQRVKAAGIPDADIRTTSYSVNPQYDQPNNGQPTLRGYQVQNLVEVRTTDLPGLGALIDAVTSVGANRIFGVRFEASDPSRFKDQAREQAMQNARAKADQLARLGGVSLGRILAIQESDVGGVIPVRADAPSAALAAPAARTPVQPGDLQVRTTVSVSWAIQ